MPASDKNRWGAMLVPDPNLAIWPEKTSVTGQGPHAGHPVPAGASQLRLLCKRQDRDADAEDVTIETVGGGLPSTTSAPRAGSFAFQRESDAAPFGWEPPVAISGWQVVRRASGADGVHRPHVAVHGDGTPCMVYEADDGDDVHLAISRFSEASGDWGFGIESAETWSDDHPLWPCLVPLPDGRMLVFHWNVELARGLAQVDVRILEDGEDLAAAAYAKSVLPAAIDVDDYDLGRLRAAYHQGEIVLIAHLRATPPAASEHDTFIQWASQDGGHSFAEVEAWPLEGGVGGRDHDVWSDDDGFHVVWMDLPNGHPANARLGSAFSSFRAAQRVVMDAGATYTWATCDGDTGGDASTNRRVARGSLAACRDETGTYYAFGYDQTTGTPQGAAGLVSFDRGRSWSRLEFDNPAAESWWETVVADYYPVDYAVAAHAGRIVLAHTGYLDPGTSDDSLGVMRLGGHTTVTLPASAHEARQGERAGWDHTWLGFARLQNCGWSTASSGTASGALSNDGETFTMTSAGATIERFRSLPTLSLGTGAYGRLRVKTDDGSSPGDPVGRFIVHISDGSVGQELEIEIAADGIRTMDVFASAQNHVADVSAGLDILWVITEVGAKVWTKPIDALHAEWTLRRTFDWIPTGTSGTITAGRISFQGESASGGESVSIAELHYSDAGNGRADRLFTNDELLGRPYSTRGTYIGDGVSVASREGPSEVGESWAISTAFDYPVDNLLSPSPRVTWRSGTDLSAEMQIGVRWTNPIDSADEDRWAGNDLLGVYLGNHNLGHVLVEGWDADTSSWVSLADVSLAIEGLGYIRAGDTVRSTGLGASTPLVRMSEFNGGYVVFSKGTTGESREIAQTWEGKWSSTSRRPVLQLANDQMDGTEPATGTTMDLVPKDAMVLISLEGRRFTGFRLRIPSPDDGSGYPTPPEGYWRIGALVIGPVLAHGDDTAWGRTLRTEPNVAMVTMPDGTRSTRVLGPPRRLELFGWADGVDTLYASEDHDDPYHQTWEDGSGEAFGLERYTPWQLEGLSVLLNGAHTPVVRIPDLDKNPEGVSVAVLNRRHELLYGRVVTPIQLDTVQGTEGSGEVMRVGQVTLAEEV